MPDTRKNLLLFMLRLAIVVLVWVLLSNYYPQLSFGNDVVTSTPVIVSPTLEPIVIPTLPSDANSEVERSLENPATVSALPATSTPLPTTEPVKALEIVIDNTQKGTILTVTGGKENYHYQLGPLAKGVYAVGPNQRFLVYVANNGIVYINRLGENRFQEVENIKHSFKALNKHVEPSFELSFHDTGYVYILFVYDGRFGETVQVILPRLITHF